MDGNLGAHQDHLTGRKTQVARIWSGNIAAAHAPITILANRGLAPKWLRSNGNDVDDDDDDDDAATDDS
eukprot:3542178-Lingulodinium_polyedra.AAC.1